MRQSLGLRRRESSSEEPTHCIELEVSSSVDHEEPAIEVREEVLAEEPVIRKSGRVTDYYGEKVSVAKDGLEEPATVTEALTSINRRPSGRKP
ncbi:MAG: hypothetical protein A6F71_09120 [Cycloclasticus sp. symbiont of Poecilosclerida sp. M]|nr:MAG: hypothetical protein A6F71_09120 [Cycloclasticus sp. symbiont of Poecilosclerida sp. M]